MLPDLYYYVQKYSALIEKGTAVEDALAEVLRRREEDFRRGALSDEGVKAAMEKAGYWYEVEEGNNSHSRERYKEMVQWGSAIEAALDHAHVAATRFYENKPVVHVLASWDPGSEGSTHDGIFFCYGVKPWGGHRIRFAYQAPEHSLDKERARRAAIAWAKYAQSGGALDVQIEEREVPSIFWERLNDEAL